MRGVVAGPHLCLIINVEELEQEVGMCHTVNVEVGMCHSVYVNVNVVSSRLCTERDTLHT